MPVIGVAIFCAGAMDAFHTLAATRLVSAMAQNNDLIPFTWALARVFNGVIMILAVSIFMTRRKVSTKNGMISVLLICLLLTVLGYLLMHLSITSANLPQSQFPDATIKRPYDVLPLSLYIFSALVIYPLFIKKHRGIFSSSLFLSAFPAITLELHMVFGSQRLFDSHFNVAHFLKIIAYVIPLSGLILDYIQTYKARLKHHSQLQAR